MAVSHSARVILLTGPSGAGKSRLAGRLHAAHGWPVLTLDDFYRELHDPCLPRSPLGIPDWDHVDSWDAEAALAALRQLILDGSALVPVYDIRASVVTGRRLLSCAPRDRVVAEGLFATRLVERLRTEGLLAEVLCVRRNRWLTFGLRLARDLAERRKPAWILVRRGLALLRAEPQLVADAVACGARTITPRRAEAELRRARHTRV